MKQAAFIIGLIILMGVVLVFLLRSLPFFGEPAGVADESGESQEEIIDVQDIIENPTVFKDLTVTVDGPVVSWVTKRAFTIGASEGVLVGSDLLVIRRDEFRVPEETPREELALGEEKEIQVTGQVEIFNIARFEQAWGVDLIDEELDVYEERAVIIADSVEEK